MVQSSPSKAPVIPRQRSLKKLPSNPALALQVNEDNTLGGALSNLSKSEDETIEKILNNLLNEENVAMKTHIKSPLNLTRLETIAKALRDAGAIQTAAIIEFFVHQYRVNWVSYDRKSREEIIHALSERFKNKKSLEDKLIEAPT